MLIEQSRRTYSGLTSLIEKNVVSLRSGHYDYDEKRKGKTTLNL
jgi:hypothetical protein